MRKYLIGILIGCALSFSYSAYAEVASMIGKTIDGQYPVSVDGKQLPNPAIVVDGTSYLPVRSFGDATGYDVLFTPEGNIILNKKQTAAQSTVTPTPTPSPTISPQEEIKKKIGIIEDQERSYNRYIKFYNDGLYGEHSPYTDPVQIQKMKDEMTQWQAELDKLEQQKATLQAQLGK